jgi:hypothetical protein
MVSSYSSITTPSRGTGVSALTGITLRVYNKVSNNMDDPFLIFENPVAKYDR